MNDHETGTKRAHAHRVTLGDQVRAEALRRGGAWPSLADECARQAERWYGHKPCRGEDLALVFSQVFRAE